MVLMATDSVSRGIGVVTESWEEVAPGDTSGFASAPLIVSTANVLAEVSGTECSAITRSS